MTHAEILGIDMLKEFVEKATEMGICYCGNDIPPSVQASVITIVEDYIEEYEEQ